MKYSQKVKSIGEYEASRGGKSITELVEPTDYSVIFLNDKEGATLGAGHSAMLIGSEVEGWIYYSKDGTTVLSPFSGPASYTVEYYSSIEEFTQDSDRDRYEQAIQFEFRDVGILGRENQEQTFNQLNSIALNHIKSGYNTKGKNCVDAVSVVLYHLGFDPGSYTEEELKSMPMGEKDTVVPFYYGGEIFQMSTFPNYRLKQLIKNNPCTDISNQLNQE